VCRSQLAAALPACIAQHREPHGPALLGSGGVGTRLRAARLCAQRCSACAARFVWQKEGRASRFVQPLEQTEPAGSLTALLELAERRQASDW